MSSFYRLTRHLLLIVVLSVPVAWSQTPTATREQLDQVKAGKFDGGRMWTFEHAPVDYLKQTYGFDATSQWLDDVRMAALRFSTFCSASFVSFNGLVMTNHHCSRDAVEKVQKKGEHLLDTGFWAATLEDERRVPDLFVEQLVQIRDVTSEIHAVMDAAPGDAEKILARNKKIDEITARFEKETSLRCQVISLYNGGKFSAYLYKRYNDVRLVFAPELQIAHYGGEYDNFTFPRYALDCTFFRVYDNGQPLGVRTFFPFSTNGASDGELTFVVGNPGRTSRLNTSEQLAFNRDIHYPLTSRMLDDALEVLQTYIRRHPDKKTAMHTQVLRVANSQKAYRGQLSGLRDDLLMKRRQDFDAQFRAAVNANPELAKKYAHLWDEIAENRARMREVAPDLYGLRTGFMVSSTLLSKSMAVARWLAAQDIPAEKRDKAFQPPALDATLRALRTPVTLNADLEVLALEAQLRFMMDVLGPQDPVVRDLTRGQDPASAASRLIAATSLQDSVALSKVLAGRLSDLKESNDPFLHYASLAWPRFEKASTVSQEIGAKDAVNNSLLGRALFDVYGTAIPPDATFTLRLADGVVAGYSYNGTRAPAWTTFYGLYDRASSFPGEEAWTLPKSWQNPPRDMDLGIPYNIATTNDIIGGNSGSPMINVKKQVVGLVFDGNIESLPGDYIFAEDMGNRTVSVHSSGILAALRYIYKAQRLVKELEQGSMR